jgi:transposase
MTLREDISGTLASTADLEERRRDACRALGIDPSTVAWPSRAASETRPSTFAAIDSEGIELADEEWQAVAPVLPPEAPQVSTMTNREFLNSVLAAMRRGGTWASPQTPAADIEAVRRRFGRWAHQGVFQALAEALPGLALSKETKRLLTYAGERAAQLRARSTR